MSSREDVTEPVRMEDFIDSPPQTPTPAPRAPMTRPLSVTSHPSLATVVIVTAGRARVAGRTPLLAAIDPRLNHDVIIAADGYDTILWRLPPHAPRSIDVHLPPAMST